VYNTGTWIRCQTRKLRLTYFSSLYVTKDSGSIGAASSIGCGWFWSGTIRHFLLPSIYVKIKTHFNVSCTILSTCTCLLVITKLSTLLEKIDLITKYYNNLSTRNSRHYLKMNHLQYRHDPWQEIRGWITIMYLTNTYRSFVHSRFHSTRRTKWFPVYTMDKMVSSLHDGQNGFQSTRRTKWSPVYTTNKMVSSLARAMERTTILSIIFLYLVVDCTL
jgi:hypothetical protein